MAIQVRLASNPCIGRLRRPVSFTGLAAVGFVQRLARGLTQGAQLAVLWRLVPDEQMPINVVFATFEVEIMPPARLPSASAALTFAERVDHCVDLGLAESRRFAGPHQFCLSGPSIGLRPVEVDHASASPSTADAPISRTTPHHGVRVVRTTRTGILSTELGSAPTRHWTLPRSGSVPAATSNRSEIGITNRIRSVRSGRGLEVPLGRRFCPGRDHRWISGTCPGQPCGAEVACAPPAHTGSRVSPRRISPTSHGRFRTRR